jgi:hypothetical protein
MKSLLVGGWVVAELVWMLLKLLAPAIAIGALTCWVFGPVPALIAALIWQSAGGRRG